MAWLNRQGPVLAAAATVVAVALWIPAAWVAMMGDIGRLWGCTDVRDCSSSASTPIDFRAAVGLWLTAGLLSLIALWLACRRLERGGPWWTATVLTAVAVGALAGSAAVLAVGL